MAGVRAAVPTANEVLAVSATKVFLNMSVLLKNGVLMGAVSDIGARLISAGLSWCSERSVWPLGRYCCG